ncbi:class I SAM-dependent methyltransferase [Tahibacter amnicola]|uniref:Class I SAM-dependent methyltransferase n=1 Tax=Tahibacter amnicola TaxID=2976241 RepID=A0ABY6BBC8_9GAMM|nr:class I SAM-dependent methyltransferase [Tahibacter amnicola]UXI66841.1 class I SAM-dependent methyltransferase [Tahibacter amnicola]
MRWIKAMTLVRWGELRLAHDTCAVCDFPLQVQLRREEMAVRCPRCGASAVTQSIVAVIRRECADLAPLSVYEASYAGPLVRFLRGRVRSLTLSEYFPDVPSGTHQDGMLCQDLQRLSFDAAQFDLCTSTEVFEHVADDLAAFAEVFRVLRPGGRLIFTVPIDPAAATVERTALRDGERREILPPEYHADRYRGQTIFCYRNYGADILDRLRTAGFTEAALVLPDRNLFGFGRPVVVARKAN